MFTKTNRNDPLVESIKNVMEQNDLLRRVETAVNEHFGVVSKKALPHEYHAEYDALFEETKKCAMAEEDKSKKADTPEHHRAEAIRAHKAIKVSGKLPHLVARKKEHEEAYRKMTGNKIKYPEDLDEAKDEGSTPRNAKEKALAKLHGDPDKITHGDVLKGRGVVEEEKMTSSEKEKEKKLKAKYDPSGMKKSMIDQYGKEKGKQVYFATIRKKAMNESIDTILEEIRSNLEEQLVYVYENYDEATFNEYVASLTEEQLEILGLNEDGWFGWGGLPSRGGKSNKEVAAGAVKGMQAGVNNPMVRSVSGKPDSSNAPAGVTKNIAVGGGQRLEPGSGAGVGKPVARGQSAIATNKPSTTPRSATPQARQAQRPSVRPSAKPGASAPTRSAQKPVDRTTTGDIMNRSVGIREDFESPKPIKESFEQFLRNKFLKG